MQNRPAPAKYTGTGKVRVLPPGVSGEDLAEKRDRKPTPIAQSRARGALRAQREAIDNPGKSRAAVRKRRRPQHCGLCDQLGHNALTCPQRARAGRREGGKASPADGERTIVITKAIAIRVRVHERTDGVDVSMTVEEP